MALARVQWTVSPCANPARFLHQFRTAMMFELSRGPLLLIVCLATQFGLIQPDCLAGEEADFGRAIRPILSDNCFLCHGPAEETREADLRLDLHDSAFDSGAIDLENPLSSELLNRINSTDPDQVMPPPDSGKKLSSQEREFIKEWVVAGANYSTHWAFVPPVRPEVPEVGDGWAKNAIDAFVMKRNRELGYQQATTADRRSLARRLYLDLTGLPPSIEELHKFLDDQSSDAIENLIEKLLRSNHFGQRWGRWWLDAARYSDSDGYEKDKPRSVWFYRDWVINAMNKDLPYDQFIVEQIAGDLLPRASQDQKVATGFLRNSMVNEEGGADPEQFRIEGMFDRMDAIGKSILGITTQCAQCHTHKYDPFSQREYYQMFAALNDFHEASIAAYTPSQQEQRDSVLSKISQIEAEIKASIPTWQEQLQQWTQDAESELVHWKTLTPEELPYEGQKFHVLPDGSIVSESYAPTKSTNTFSIHTNVRQITGFRLDALKHPQLPRGGPGRSIYGTGAVTEFEVAIAPANDPGAKRLIKLARPFSDANPAKSRLPAIYRDKDPSKDQRTTGGIEFAIDGDGNTAWSTDVGPGRRNRDRLAVFRPEEPITESGEVIISFTLKQNHGGWNSDDNQNYLLGRYRFSISEDHLPASIVPAEIESVLRKPELKRTQAERASLFSYWRTTIPELSEANAAIQLAWAEYPETDSQLVVEALQQPRETYVFARGDFLNPIEQVSAGTPNFLGQFSDSDPEPDRLRFARWLVRRDAPTTARVIVNRIWQSYFGRALVTSPEDFGFQSQPPSHPELLDWLAVELMDSGWSLKHIHRLIANSATYQQSSVLTQDMAEADPQNQWLARGPRFRVDAESVRDIALSISGLLNPEMGGPSVYPPAPEFLFQPPASYGPKIWNVATNQSQYRRSVYVHSYRSVPYPVLQVFDAPKGDAACIRRERSNTPLQSLVLLNEPQFVECARAMATRVLRAEPDDENSRMKYAFELATCRQPTSHEIGILERLLSQQKERIVRGDLDVSQLIGVPQPLYRQLAIEDPQELAAWMLVTRTLINLDETITKQ